MDLYSLIMFCVGIYSRFWWFCASIDKELLMGGCIRSQMIDVQREREPGCEVPIET